MVLNLGTDCRPEERPMAPVGHVAHNRSRDCALQHAVVLGSDCLLRGNSRQGGERQSNGKDRGFYA